MAEHIFEQLAREARAAEQHAAGWFHGEPVPQPHYPSAAPAAAHTSAAPAAAPAIQHLEGHTPAMLEELKRLLDLAVDENTLKAINAVLTHPEGRSVLSDVAAVAGIHVPAGTITAAANGLKAVLAVAGHAPVPAPADAAVPA